MVDEWDKLKDRMSGLSTEELLNVVGVEYKDYRPEALQFAMAELDRRGVQYRAPAGVGAVRSGAEVVDEEAGEEGSEAEPDSPVCKKCGGEARLGYLFTDREITIVFSDNNEERFVEVHACGKCGHVELEVDFDTDVESSDRL
jgi:hypothetical protein